MTVSTQLQLFQCPSAPNSNRTDPYHVIGAAAGDYGSINEVKKKVYTQVLGVADPGSSARAGLLSKFNENRIGSCLDGTSNTLFVAECAGQPEVWIASGPMTMEDFAKYTDDKVVDFGGRLVPADGVGWADPDCGFSINGATSDGLNKYGEAMINAINVSEVYSFHSGGASFSMADGSTHFIKEAILVTPVISGQEESNSASPGRIELIGVAEISGSATDHSGLNQVLHDDSTNDMLGGFSGVAYSGKDSVYYFLSDRGPGEGAVDWTCRFQRFRIDIDLEVGAIITTELLGTNLLVNDKALPFSGLASAFVKSKTQSGRLDPEGIRVTANGNVLISDEYGPRLIEFSPTGEIVREFSVPPRYLIRHPGLTKSDENRANTIGRQANRGMEGLAISSDGNKVFGLMQSPLLQDSFRREMTDKPTGLNCRLLQFSFAGQLEKEMLYHLSDDRNKLNEILATGANTWIVIERDGEAGAAAKFKKLMLVSTENASDIKGIDNLPATKIPVSIQPVSKRVLIDLLDPQWKLAGAKMPEKIEGLAFGPNLPDGRRTLLVTSDNDFRRQNPSYIYAFAVPAKLLDMGRFAKPNGSSTTILN